MPSHVHITWKNLDSLRKIDFLKASYVVLSLVPLLALIQHLLSLPPQYAFLKEMPIVIRLTYFSSLFISVAHMLYQGFCPTIIKRFDSPNDLYRELLGIKELQLNFLPSDSERFTFDIEHCRKNFTKLNISNSFARWLCFLTYVIGAFLFGIVLIIQGLRVIGIFVP